MTQTTFDRVERRTVAVEVRERLIEAIRNGELIAGTALPAERVLCEQFNVARTSVREAIQGLATAGFIERRGNRAFVVEVVPGLELALDSRKATVRNLFEVRRVIEPAMAGLVALRAPEHVRREIADLASRHASGIDEFRLIDRQFHQMIASACDNPVLSEVYSKALASLFNSEEFASLLYAENNKEEVSNIVESSSHAHVEIAEALLAGDQVRTEKAVAAHLRDVEARMLERLV